MSHRSITKCAVDAGKHSRNDIYVGRAHHNGGMIPGKLLSHSGLSRVYIPYDGQEVSKVQYQVLIAPKGTLSWVDGEGGNIPSNAVIGGQDPNGETYYIGRVLHEGVITVGKVHQTHGTCYVPHAGKEHGYQKYEILVRNAYGAAIDA